MTAEEIAQYSLGYREALEGTRDWDKGTTSSYREGFHDGLCWLGGL